MVNTSRGAVKRREQDTRSMPTIPGKVLEELWSNLAELRLRDPERRTLVVRTAFLAEGLSIPRASMSRDWRTAEEHSRSFDLRSVPFANPIGLLPEQYASMKDARRGIFGHFGIS